jgi:hypothetical protein
MSYKVYLYNIPKVSEDGKQSIPVPDSQVKEFDGAEDAKIFAAEHKNNFDSLGIAVKASNILYHQCAKAS